MWRRLGEKGFGEKQSQSFSVVPDGEIHVYQVNLAASPEYAGVITQLRLADLPADKQGSVRLKSVVLGKNVLLSKTKNETSVGFGK